MTTKSVPKASLQRNPDSPSAITNQHSETEHKLNTMPTNTRHVTLAMICLLGWAAHADADVTVDKMFTDHMVLQRDLAVPIWGTAEPKEAIEVRFRDQSRKTTADKDGKWIVKLDKLKVGVPGKLTISGKNTVTLDDVLVGEVWVGSGQSNMAGRCGNYMRNDKVLAEMANGGPYPTLRLYGRSGWQVADKKTAPAFSALHFAFGFNLHKELKVPVGLMVGAVGGTPSGRWLSGDMAAADEALMEKLKATGRVPAGAQDKKQKDGKKGAGAAKPHKFGDLYARFIEPKVPYGIRGVLWDQGESRTQIPGVDQYTAMNALINGWRKTWGQGDFHFLHIQKPSGEGCAWDAANPTNRGALKFGKLLKNHTGAARSLEYPLRHIKIGTLRNAPLVIASDLRIGIHPQCKSGYGKRACRVALGVVYGKGVAVSGPVYKSHKVEGSAIRVAFDHVGKGLALRHAESVQGFEIAGEDGKWAWADAKIDGDAILVSSKEVAKPVRVRYAFARRHNFANLFNKDGLPALMFTTVKWEK
jgi:sialate O-acetylesterase